MGLSSSCVLSILQCINYWLTSSLLLYLYLIQGPKLHWMVAEDDNESDAVHEVPKSKYRLFSPFFYTCCPPRKCLLHWTFYLQWFYGERNQFKSATLNLYHNSQVLLQSSCSTKIYWKNINIPYQKKKKKTLLFINYASKTLREEKD